MNEPPTLVTNHFVHDDEPSQKFRRLGKTIISTIDTPLVFVGFGVSFLALGVVTGNYNNAFVGGPLLIAGAYWQMAQRFDAVIEELRR